MDWVSLVGKISIWIILLPLLIGAINLAKLDQDSRFIFFIVAIGAIPQVLNPFIEGTNELNFLYNLYTPLEFFIYWRLFYSNVPQPGLRKTCFIVLGLFAALSFIFLSQRNMYTEFVKVWVVTNNICQLILSGICLLAFYDEDGINFTINRPLFWYIIGIALYASCTVVFYSLWDYVKRNSTTNVSSLKLIHHVFNILLYLLFTRGLLLNLNLSKPEPTDE